MRHWGAISSAFLALSAPQQPANVAPPNVAAPLSAADGLGDDVRKPSTLVTRRNSLPCQGRKNNSPRRTAPTTTRSSQPAPPAAQQDVANEQQPLFRLKELLKPESQAFQLFSNLRRAYDSAASILRILPAPRDEPLPTSLTPAQRYIYAGWVVELLISVLENDFDKRLAEAFPEAAGQGLAADYQNIKLKLQEEFVEPYVEHDRQPPSQASLADALRLFRMRAAIAKFWATLQPRSKTLRYESAAQELLVAVMNFVVAAPEASENCLVNYDPQMDFFTSLSYFLERLNRGPQNNDKNRQSHHNYQNVLLDVVYEEAVDEVAAEAAEAAETAESEKEMVMKSHV